MYNTIYFLFFFFVFVWLETMELDLSTTNSRYFIMTFRRLDEPMSILVNMLMFYACKFTYKRT